MTTRTAEPRFEYGQTVTVTAAHERAYPRRARGGAVGVITDVGRIVNGTRRYSVSFDAYYATPHAPAPPMRIPEAHLKSVAPAVVEMPAVTETRPALRCQHDWQVWPDGRYRLCHTCGQAERVSAVEASHV